VKDEVEKELVPIIMEELGGVVKEVEACTPSVVIDCRYRGFTAVTYSVFKVESRKRRVYVVRRVYEDERPFDKLHESISFIEGKKLVGVVRPLKR